MRVEKHKRKGGGHSKNRKLDAVQVQVSVKYRKIRGRKLSKKVIEQAIRKYANTGKLPRGFIWIKITQWKNPDSIANPEWRNQGPQKERLATLRGILQRGRIRI